MKVIYKYPLVPETCLPVGAEILHIGLQGLKLCVWALADPEEKTFEKRIVLLATGQLVNDFELTTYTHYQTFLLDAEQSYVIHVFTRASKTDIV